MVGVLGEDAAGLDGLAELEGLFALGKFAGGDVEVELAGDGVDDDAVTVPDQRERSADVGLGRDVADHESARAAGKTAVGDERDVVAEPAAHDGRGGREHFAHAGAALGSFVADHDHVAFLDLIGARFPYMITRWLVGLIGLSKPWITSWPFS